MRGDDLGASILAPKKNGTFHFGGQVGDKTPFQRKRGWTITVQPLEFMVLPMRFERMAYRLGGDRSILLSYGSRLVRMKRCSCSIQFLPGVTLFLANNTPTSRKIFL